MKVKFVAYWLYTKNVPKLWNLIDIDRELWFGSMYKSILNVNMSLCEFGKKESFRIRIEGKTENLTQKNIICDFDVFTVSVMLSVLESGQVRHIPTSFETINDHTCPKLNSQIENRSHDVWYFNAEMMTFLIKHFEIILLNEKTWDYIIMSEFWFNILWI